MPNITVNGVSLSYEVFGRGPAVVWSTQGWSPRDNLAYLIAGRLSAHFRVLLWDRRNSGASDVAMVETATEQDLWIEDLHGLLAALDMSPAYLAGACRGAALSLGVARQYPADARGMILVAPPLHYTLASAEVAFIFDGYFRRPIELAENQGMEAAIAESVEASVRLGSARWEPRDRFLNWIAQTVFANPGNRDRLLTMDPLAFARTLRKWEAWYGRGPGHVHGVAYQDIRPINVPALVAHGFDPIHPKDTAEELYRLLPNAKWVEYSERYTKDEMELAGYSWSLSLPFIEEFLDRSESK